MYKIPIAVCLCQVLLYGCTNPLDQNKPHVGDSSESAQLNRSDLGRVGKDTLSKELSKGADITCNLQGIWAAVGDENATFVISKDSITYPDQNLSYSYRFEKDSIHIQYDGFAGQYLVETRGSDTLVLVGDESTVYYRFKK